MEFFKHLYTLRNKKGISQEELAFSIGVSRQTINAWETGVSYPNILMLKTLSDFFEVSADELLNGLSVHRLPTHLESIQLTDLGAYDGRVTYNELPNWFIALTDDAQVAWAIYDNGVKDYSYHLTVVGRANIHGFLCREIKVEEYNPQLDLEHIYSLFVSQNQDGIYWVGKMSYENGIKVVSTFKDQAFLKDWGTGGKFKPHPTHFENARKFMMEYGETKKEVIRISYFESNALDSKEDYFEVYLNRDFESLFWKRYSKKIKNAKDKKVIDGIDYGLEGSCITNRL
jgi:transcriptional regulator with XRE-family HTH domain